MSKSVAKILLIPLILPHKLLLAVINRIYRLQSTSVSWVRPSWEPGWSSEFLGTQIPVSVLLCAKNNRRSPGSPRRLRSCHEWTDEVVPLIILVGMFVAKMLVERTPQRRVRFISCVAIGADGTTIMIVGKKWKYEMILILLLIFREETRRLRCKKCSRDAKNILHWIYVV